jgi:transitional endoplasmic reticulum ATPase
MNQELRDLLREAVLGTMSEKEQKKTDTEIERAGRKIILPSDPKHMSYDEAIDTISRKKREEETKINVVEEIDAYPFEGAYAFMNVLKDLFGWAEAVPTPGFFGDNPPVTVGIEIGFQKNAQIIWGRVKIPGVDGHLETAIGQKRGRPIFVIRGEIRKKNQLLVLEIANQTREWVKKNSIYRGQAIKLRTDGDGDLTASLAPEFLDLSRVNPDELTFGDDVAAQVSTNIWTLIEHTEACRKNKIPLKRGILCEGPFGTGKTLTAFVTAQKCVANKWTFIMVDRVQGLDAALEFARQYQPAVVFAEDVDRAIAGQERTTQIDDILNTIDGVESKGTEVITILTSNNATSINRAMLRPGRLDAVISIQAPDSKAAMKLIKLYARDSLDPKADLKEAGKAVNGQIPAVIREVVERAKLYAIGRTGSADIKIVGDDIVHSARQMTAHLELLNPTKKEVVLTPQQKLGLAFAEVMATGIEDHPAIDTIKKKVNEVHEEMGLVN